MSLLRRIAKLESSRKETPGCPVCGGAGMLRVEIEGQPRPETACPRCGRDGSWMRVVIAQVESREMVPSRPSA